MKKNLYILVLCSTFWASAQLQENLVNFTLRLNQLQQLLSGALPASVIQQISTLPPVLDAIQLNQLDANQKKYSDELMVDFLINLAQVEFYSLPSMEQFIVEALQQLRANMLFFQRAALDKLLDEQEGLFPNLKIVCTPDPNQNFDDFLLQSYAELQKKEASIFYITLHNLVKDCFFNANAANDEPIIAAFLQLCATAIVAQRKKPSAISGQQAKKSDATFMALFQEYQERNITDLHNLGYELNRLRLLPDFLKYTEYMLYPINKNVLKEDVIPLIPFVRNISQFLSIKTGFAAANQLGTQARRFLFDKNLWEATIDNHVLRQVFDDEFKQASPIITNIITLQDFIVQELPKVKNLTQLDLFFKRLENDYKAELQSHLKKFTEIRNMILGNQQQLDVQEIINFLTTVTNKRVPESFITFLETIQNDIVLIKTIRDDFDKSISTEQDFGKILLKNIQHPAVQKELVSLHRTPRSIYLVIQNEFKNKEMKYALSDQLFYFEIKPCGMLIRVLEFFIREVDKKEVATNNWQMLRRSLECMNNPRLCFEEGGPYYTIYQAIHNAFYPKNQPKSAIAKRIEEGRTANIQLAPELFNFYVENNVLKQFDFVTSLQAYRNVEDYYYWGIYDNKLNNILTEINSKNAGQIVAQVRKFVERTEIIPTDKEPFITFAQNLENALRITINQLPK